MLEVMTQKELLLVLILMLKHQRLTKKVNQLVIQKVAKPEGPQKVATWQARCGPPTPTLIPWNRTAGARPTPNY